MKNQKKWNRLFTLLISLVFVFQVATPAIIAMAADSTGVSVLGGLVTVTYTQGTAAEVDGVVKVTV